MTHAAEVWLYAAKNLFVEKVQQMEHGQRLHVTAMVELLSSTYISLIRRGIPFRAFSSVMLWGAPGVGKSQGVRQIAERIKSETGKNAVITDVRLLLFNPVDLRGIPTANADKTLAIWLRPKIFQMDESADTVNILFLDEISAAPPSVQAAAYQITLDRTIGEHRLPDNCIVIAAGNRVTDKSVAYNMPKALANRLCHLEIIGDPRAWHDWAVKNRLHHFVIGYLDYNPVALMKFDPSGTELSFPTPRSWEMVSGVLKNVSEELTAVYPLIVGCIGAEAASALRSWSCLYEGLPAPEEVFSGAARPKPKAAELRTALRASLVDYAGQHPDPVGLIRSIEHACELPWEYRKALLHDYSLLPEVRAQIKDHPVFREALRRGLS